MVQQLPNWMFTFTNSGSDLLARSLAMILARPETLKKVRLEMSQRGPLTDSDAINDLAFLEACIMETGRLFPPVSKTVHKAAQRDEFQGVEIPQGTEILQLFPLSNRDTTADAQANDFVPARWMDPRDKVHDLYPNLFLSGARACPGRDLILFIDKSAIAYLLTHQFHAANQNRLSEDPLPLSFPEDTLRF